MVDKSLKTAAAAIYTQTIINEVKFDTQGIKKTKICEYLKSQAATTKNTDFINFVTDLENLDLKNYSNMLSCEKVCDVIIKFYRYVYMGIDK